MMFNELGQQNEGLINKSLSGVSYLVENYERVGRVLLGLVGTYGVCRTALMAAVAMKLAGLRQRRHWQPSAAY